jgi:uncharacterized membrane protein (UPF0127 family)
LEIICKAKNIYLGKRIKTADSFWDRLIGLMFSSDMFGFDGLLIKPCNSIHTFFMEYNLDVAFLDKDLKIVKIIRNLKPWRITGLYLKANQVLELKAGALDSKIVEGDQVLCLN